VARSSAESELRALVDGISKGLWVRLILQELQLFQPVTIQVKCDNKSAIAILNNPVQHERTKHIEIDKHFFKEKIDMGIINPVYISSTDQTADIFTKGLPGPAFQKLCNKLGMDNIHSQLEGGC